jgi:uncharacterized Tic20 family protein
MWAMIAQLSGIVIGFIGSLVIMLIFGPRNAFVKSQSTEALNFQITVAIGYVVGVVLSLVFIGVLILLAVWVLNIVFCIIAGLKNNSGEEYRYPFTLRLVK